MCRKKIVINLVYFLFIYCFNMFIWAEDNHLCQFDEVVYFNCYLEDGKRVSLCAHKHYPQRIQYRQGTSINHLEVQFPEKIDEDNAALFNLIEDALGTGAETIGIEFTYQHILYGLLNIGGFNKVYRENMAKIDLLDCLTNPQINDNLVGFSKEADPILFKDAMFYKWNYGAKITQEKAYLYEEPDKKTKLKMYLIKGDIIKLLQRQGNHFSPGNFYEIEYESAKKGTIKKWLHCEAIDAC